MNKELFNELLESVKQGAAIMKGRMKPSRHTEVPESQHGVEKWERRHDEKATP